MTKRYYKKLAVFPEGVDRLEADLRLPVDEDRLADWLDEYFRTGGMKAMVGYIILRCDAWEEAMNLGLDGEPRIAFRATWALEWAYEQSEPEERPEWFFDRMADDFVSSSNGSLHRVYAKMLLDQMRFGGICPTPGQAERLADRCLDLVSAPATKTAVRFWCLEILCELSPCVEWVGGELAALLRRLGEASECPAGMRVALREIGKRIDL